MTRWLLVKRINDPTGGRGGDSIVHRVEVTGKPDSQVDKVEMGLMRNMDLDRFYVDDVRLDDAGFETVET